MNTFTVTGVVTSSTLHGRCLTIIILEQSGLRHQLSAFGTHATKLHGLAKKHSTVLARGSRKLDSKSEMQYWMLESIEVLVQPPFFQEESK